MIIMDTDICIEILRGNRAVIQKRGETAETVGVSFISAGELFYGAQKSSTPESNSRLVGQFLATLPVVHTTMPILERFGFLKATFEKKGYRLSDADILVAATALTCGGNLATGNTQHFQRFKGLNLLNWRF